jgi:E3 ubiquitin-protein ligase UBR1
MTRTVACALDFVLDTLDYSPEDAVPPHDEDELRSQPSAEPVAKEHYTLVIWNDDKHSFEEVIQNICETTSCPGDVASEKVTRVDEEVLNPSRPPAYFNLLSCLRAVIPSR